MQKAVTKTTLLLVFTFLISLPALSQYRHPGEDLPKLATMLNLSPQQSWITFFCPETEPCEAHVVCYYKGEPAALDPVTIEPRSGARLNLYEALRDIKFSAAAARSRKNCEVRSAQDLDVRAYTRIGDQIVKASEKTVAVKLRGFTDSLEFVKELPNYPEDFAQDLKPQYLYPSVYTVWTTVHEDPNDECGGRGDIDVGIVFAVNGIITGAKNEIRLFGFVTENGEMGGHYFDALTGRPVGSFKGQTTSKRTASGNWNSGTWGCIGTWELSFQ